MTAEQRQPRIPVRYKTAHQDSARWDELEFRPGDIVISARPRSGTTWMQMICALDAAVSLYHHYANLDVRRLSRLQGLPDPGPAAPAPPLREWLRSWTGQDARPEDRLDSLAGYIRHAADAWARRDAPNVVLAHYADLSADLPGEMRRMAGRLGVAVPAGRWPALLSAATFPQMRAHASQLVQGPPGIIIDDAGFFRSGTSGAGRGTLSEAELATYHAKAALMAPADALAWLHR